MSAVRAVISRWVESGASITTIFDPFRTQSVAVACGGGRDVLPMVTGRRFGRGQRNNRPTGDDLLQYRGGGFSAGAAQESARHHDRVDVGLDHQCVTKRLGNDHDFDWAPADSAHILGQAGTQDAEFVGESSPDIRLPTCAALGGGAALLQVVPRRQEFGQPVAQQFLFVGQIEVHHSPNAALARILR